MEPRVQKLLTPTHTTAAIAGAWSALGFVPLDIWSSHHKASSSVLLYDLVWLATAVVFLFLPLRFFVIGSERIGRAWFLNPDSRRTFGKQLVRGFVWLISAAAVGTLSELLLSQLPVSMW